MLQSNNFTKYTNSGDAKTLVSLRKLGITCCTFQGFLSIICLSGSAFFAKSNFIAIGCGILAIIISLIPIFYSIFNNKILLIFSCLTAFNIAPIWFLYLEAVLPGYDAYEYILPEYRMQALFWISAFLFFTNLFYVIFWRKFSIYSINNFLFLEILRLKPSFFMRLSVIAFIVPLISFYFFYGSTNTLWIALTAGRSGGAGSGLLIRDSIGDSSALMLPLVWIWQLTPLFGVITYVSSKSKIQFFPILSLALGLLVIFVFFLGGSRGTMIFVGAPVLFFIFYYNWNRGIKFWIIAVALFFVFIGIMELQVRFRGNLLDVITDPAKAAAIQGISSATTFDPTKSHRDNNLYLLSLLVKSYPSKYDFEGFNDFFAVVLNPIPRAFWANKPILKGAKDISYQSAFILEGPLEMGTTSLSYSVVGEAYQASGLWGILIYSIVYALFLIYFDGIIYYTKEKRAFAVGVFGVGVFLAFWGYRSFFALVTFLYPIMLFILFFSLIKTLKRNANHIYRS